MISPVLYKANKNLVENIPGLFLNETEDPDRDSYFNTIREINLKIAEIRDTTSLKIKFASIRNSEKKKYCFTVEPVSEIIETPITLQLSAPDIYPEGETILNGEKKKEDIVFQLVYRT